MTIVSQRRTLHQVIERLPDNLVMEVVTFVKFLQFKEQEAETLQDDLNEVVDMELEDLMESEETPSFRPVYFPEGSVTDFDFSPEYIMAARKEIWTGMGDPLNESIRE